MGVVEKIKEIEEEMARTQKNKATEYHLGLLKAKLARYRAQLLEPATKSGPAGVGFDVQKAGDARVALIGFPSVGKSTLLSKTTHTASEVASYEFTQNVDCDPRGHRVQRSSNSTAGSSRYRRRCKSRLACRGRGRQVVSTAKTADLILIMLDATKSEEHRRLLEIELDAVGIRLNKRKPDVVFKRRTTGGITINCTVKLTRTDEKTIRTILAGYKLHNCDVMIREDVNYSFSESLCIYTADRLQQTISSTSSSAHENIYPAYVYVYNKIDAISLETMDKLARTPNTVVISCEMARSQRGTSRSFGPNLPPKGRNDRRRLQWRAQKSCAELSIWTCLGNIFLVGSRNELKFPNDAQGRSSKFNPHAQKVSLSHQVQDEDVVSIFTK
ncbi:p-loop containing nucleoside triphosphate hydrolase protein [Mycena sanguinolenta]|uniref:p-loop containing nucleoside triphosphate hydrolase protein n=1 Tax=Mycena sanguinolenta TaxID=230812 RepID=A0A8H6YZS3_9AGAR|nr:p-loop containing nucleoside triphosphate hydrolase protein [Mycena sanguinolenta]